MKIYEKPVLIKLSIAQEQPVSAFGTLFEGFESLGGEGFGGVTSYCANSGTVIE
ncbi:MAG: hypothetical protein IKC83_05130 [Clostridia bacterium]|nr:hypothetical protein [Clostridia bacterium]